MPFEKGNQLAKNQGRKGYELEKEQLERMQRIYDKNLLLIEKIQDSEIIDSKDRDKLILLQQVNLKIMDKLHASRQTQEHSGEISLPQPILGGITKKDEV